MTRLAMTVVAVLCLHSCTLAADVVEVSVTVPEVTQHEVTHLGIQVTNHSEHPVLLDSIRVVETGAAYTWEEQVYGSLSYSQGDDAFIHNRMAQMASQFKLSSAILPPGGEAQHALALTLDKSGPVELTVVLSYNLIHSDELAARIYLPRSESPLEGRYTPATVKELTGIGAPGPIAELPLHFKTRDLPRPRQTRARVGLTVKEAEFPLQEAMQRISITSHEYDAESKTWLLDTRSGMWVVTREHAEFVPGLGAEERRFIEESAETVPFWFVLEDLPEAMQPKVRELIASFDPEEGMGVRFDTPRDQVLPLAEELAKVGLRLELADFQLIPMLAVRPIDDH